MIYIDGKYIDFLDKNNHRHHRENGPAVINGNRQEWWVNGKIHRLDGPAVITNNYKKWYINGMEYNETEYHNKLKEMGLE